MALTIDITKSNSVTYLVKLIGSLDTETAELLDSRIKEALADPKTLAIRMDLHELSYISSIGLGSLSKIRKDITLKGGIMVTVGAQPQITRVFEIVKMMPKETVFATREEADKYLGAIQAKVIEDNR